MTPNPQISLIFWHFYFETVQMHEPKPLERVRGIDERHATAHKQSRAYSLLKTHGMPELFAQWLHDVHRDG